MPTYQYACTECGERVEQVQKFTDDPLTVCPACGGKLRKVFSPVGIVFKGSGFYRNDSRKAPAETGASSGSGGKADSSGAGSSGESAAAGSGESSGEKSAEKSGGSEKAPAAEKKSESAGASSTSSGTSGSSGSSGSSGTKVA